MDWKAILKEAIERIEEARDDRNMDDSTFSELGEIVSRLEDIAE